MSRKDEIQVDSIGRLDVEAAFADDEDLGDRELLGHAMFSTTGEVVVMHDWLEEKWEEHGLVGKLQMPGLPWTSSAYKRAMRFLVHPGKTDSHVVNGREVELDLRDGDGNIKHLEASMFKSAEESGEEGGSWETHKLGFFGYDSDSQSMDVVQKIGEDHELADLWDEMVARAREMFDVMQEAHVGDDIRDILYYFTHFNSKSVKLRDGGAVYFVPAQYNEVLEGLQALWSDMNESDEVWKQGDDGARCEIVTMEVFDTEDKVDFVEHRVEQRLEEDLERALDEAWGILEDDEDDEDATADEIVRAIEDDLRNMESLESDYNTLLNAKLSVKRKLEDVKSGLSDDDKEEVIETAVEQVTN